MHGSGTYCFEAIWVAGPVGLREGDGALECGGLEAGPGDGGGAAWKEKGVPEVGEDFDLTSLRGGFGEMGDAGGAGKGVTWYFRIAERVAAEGFLAFDG